MAFTDPFGDFSDNYQRHGNIPTGGMAIECGCITGGNIVDSTFYVPTKMSECYAVILDNGGADFTDNINGIPCVTDGYIKCSLTGTIGGSATTYHNYMAVGN